MHQLSTRRRDTASSGTPSLEGKGKKWMKKFSNVTKRSSPSSGVTQERHRGKKRGMSVSTTASFTRRHNDDWDFASPSPPPPRPRRPHAQTSFGDFWMNPIDPSQVRRQRSPSDLSRENHTLDGDDNHGEPRSPVYLSYLSAYMSASSPELQGTFHQSSASSISPLSPPSSAEFPCDLADLVGEHGHRKSVALSSAYPTLLQAPTSPLLWRWGAVDQHQYVPSEVDNETESMESGGAYLAFESGWDTMETSSAEDEHSSCHYSACNSDEGTLVDVDAVILPVKPQPFITPVLKVINSDDQEIGPEVKAPMQHTPPTLFLIPPTPKESLDNPSSSPPSAPVEGVKDIHPDISKTLDGLRAAWISGVDPITCPGREVAVMEWDVLNVEDSCEDVLISLRSLRIREKRRCGFI